MAAQSLFEREAAQIPALVAQQMDQAQGRLAQPLARLELFAPRLVATLARGSSSNAAALAGYAAGLSLGLPTAALPPSIASVYGRTLHLERALVLAISQSGASPDLVISVRAARAAGALTVGLINESGSDLGRAVAFEIDIGAGSERAIAATKTFVLSVTAVLHLIAMWSKDAMLTAALMHLPDVLERCAAVDWSPAAEMLAGCAQAFVIGRGPAQPLARELALKLAEVSGLLAEAQSAAELLHGPISIASPDMPAIVFAGDQHSAESVRQALAKLQVARAPTLLLAPESQRADGGNVIHVPSARHELLQPLVSLVAMYPALAHLARQRGRDPDRPPHLKKSTRTC